MPHPTRFATATLAAILSLGAPAPSQVTTAQYDNARTGADTVKRRLTPRNVGAAGFGKL